MGKILQRATCSQKLDSIASPEKALLDRQNWAEVFSLEAARRVFLPTCWMHIWKRHWIEEGKFCNVPMTSKPGMPDPRVGCGPILGIVKQSDVFHASEV